MHDVEVLERRWQLRQDGCRVDEVHAAEVVAPERVDEALGDAVGASSQLRRMETLSVDLFG